MVRILALPAGVRKNFAHEYRRLSDEGAIPPENALPVFPHPGRECQQRPLEMFCPITFAFAAAKVRESIWINRW
jgi:hypothetical protein